MGYIYAKTNPKTGKSEIPSSIRQQIRRRVHEIYREGKFRTYAEFADHLQLPLRTVEKWFQADGTIPDMTHARQIAALCSVSLDWLLAGKRRSKQAAIELDLETLLKQELIRRFQDIGYSADDIGRYLLTQHQLLDFIVQLIRPDLVAWRNKEILEEYRSQYRSYLADGGEPRESPVSSSDRVATDLATIYPQLLDLIEEENRRHHQTKRRTSRR
jgi:hypothetical protein